MYWQHEKSDTSFDAVDLDVLWVDARKNKEGVINNEQVQEVTLKERPCLMQTPDSQAVLDKALGLSRYSSRIWGAGFGVTSSCKLFLDIPSTRVVGFGTMHNTSDVMLHNACIPLNHVNVAIDTIIEDNTLFPIPLDEDIITLGGAIGTYVTWPTHLVDIVPIMGKGIPEHGATSPPRVEHASKKAKVVKSKLIENKLWSKSSIKNYQGRWSPRRPTTVHS
ncbi:hypothetical protein Lal_00026244 [Lupinus albus]|nr:hypothetical protein Lal_00026244 [Lupinus albus]